MPGGRKHKPTALKILQGNPGRRPLPVEPPLSKTLKCPKHLDPEARREWRRLVNAFESVDCLRITDQTVLAAHCAAYSRWVAAEKAIATEGLSITLIGGRGQTRIIRNPAIQVSIDAVRQMVSTGALLGLSPVDRVKISAPPKEKVNPFGGIDEDEAQRTG